MIDPEGGLNRVYADLTEKMPTFDKQGLSYITGEQCISRLNDSLGVDGWDFAVKRVWFDREADCVMCIGSLTVRWPNGITSTHEDIGSQIPNRKKDGSFVELGSDYKGSRTDCLKRCAADIGVGLWLYHKQSGSTFERKAQPTPRPAPAPRVLPTPINGQALTCVECGNALTETRFGDGTVWTPADLAGHGQRKYGRVLDMPCYRKAKAAASQPKQSDEAIF